jgi:hypothetical protein
MSYFGIRYNIGILNGFSLGSVDVARLNFGILTIITNVSREDEIRQFRPIALINVIFKFAAKACYPSFAHCTQDY